jgi:Fe-S cluster biogenesis protein NfuA/rhodanese-related sulfurtransferase
MQAQHKSMRMSASDSPIELSRECDPVREPALGDLAAPAPEDPALANFRLTPEGLLERRRTGQTVYVFDLRDVEAFRDGHLPGAYSLPFEYLESNLHRLPFTGDLLFYDGGEGLAAQAARLLHENGFTDQSYAEEGFQALMAALEHSPEELHYGRLSPEERRRAIDRVLDEKVREFLARDGGGLEVKAVEDDRVLVAYFGACGGCGSSTAGTLRFIQGALTVALNHEIEVVPVEEEPPA